MIKLPPRIKNTIDKTGPPKFKYQITIVLKNSIMIKYFNLFIKMNKSSLPHLINGPKIIPTVSGINKGERIELKNGAPIESFLLRTTFEKIG